MHEMSESASPPSVSRDGIRRLALMTGVATTGWILATTTGLHLVTRSGSYLAVATTLLVIGLYSSTNGISGDELRAGARTVALAVTVGVLAKAALIAAIMFAVYREPRYAVLGLAVAQIDPLAVAAMSAGSRISARARALLSAWAAFDDPITVLLTLYAATWLLGTDAAGGTDSFAAGLGRNAILAVAGFGMWALLQRIRRRAGDRIVLDVAELLGLAALLAAAVAFSLALGVALLGLFYRPRVARWLPPLTQGAFLSACFLLGFALSGGIDLLAGLLLGVCAYGAQVLAGLLIPARIDRHDRAYLALGQQNGITAIILALLLEASFPGTIAVVAPAILVVAVLYTAANAALDSGRLAPA